MKNILAVCIAILLFASCAKDIVHGKGSVVTEERTVAAFSAIDVSGNGKVYISYAPELKVILKAYSNLIPHYETEVINGILHLHYKEHTLAKNDNLEVYITMPTFNGLSLSGSAKIEATGAFENTDNLSVSTSGNGKINIQQLNTDFYNINSSGSSDISTLGVVAKEASVHISGNSTISLSVTDKLDVHISGNGKVSYEGDPETINTDISGNGKVIKL